VAKLNLELATDGLCACGCGQPTRIAEKTSPRDGAVAGRPVRFLSGHNRRVSAKLNHEIAGEIRRRAATGERQREIAKAFGVTPPTINAIVHGRLYPDQPRPPRQATPARPRRPTPNATRILGVLSGRSSACSPLELAEITGLSRGRVGDALRVLRLKGVVERVGQYQETRYRMVRATAAPTAPRGDRPRALGLRAAWLREHASQLQGEDSPDQATEAAAL
jgi:DNA-binding transcriptional ArsR family regulator